MEEQLICPVCAGDITRETGYPSSFICPCGTIKLVVIPKETDIECAGVIQKKFSVVSIGAGRAPSLGTLG